MIKILISYVCLILHSINNYLNNLYLYQIKLIITKHNLNQIKLKQNRLYYITL